MGIFDQPITKKKTNQDLDNHIGNNKTKESNTTPPPKKKVGPLGCMLLAHVIGCQKFLCLPLFIFTIYDLG